MKRAKRRGFTIVELVIVIAVVAVLVAVLIPTFGNVINNAKDSAAMQEAKNAYTTYITDNPGITVEYAVYESDDRWVALKGGVPVGVYESKADAIATLGLAEDKFSMCEDEALWVYAAGVNAPDSEGRDEANASSYGIVPGKVDTELLHKLFQDTSIANKTIVFADGEYIFSSTIHLSSNVTLVGGANTVFKLDSASSDFILLSLKDVDNVKISNIKLQGEHNARPSQKGNTVGIRIERCRSVNLEELDVVGWGLYGVYGKTMSSYGTPEEGKFYKQLQVVNSRFYNNYCGSYFDYRCEYSQVLNCAFGENHIGSVNCGGNNMYTSCMWNANDYGFILENDGSNPAHGGCNSCTFNHNYNTSIQINNCVNGWTFDGCQNFYGKIVLKNSKGVIFNSNIWGSCTFYSTYPGNANCNLISNTYFQTDSAKILANNDGSTLVYCCLPDHLPDTEETENILDDATWEKILSTQEGTKVGSSNAYFANCSTTITAGKQISNFYIAITGANKNTIVNGVNVWVVNATTNTITEKIVDNRSILVNYSNALNKFVLNIEVNKTYDYPVYFVVQATRSADGKIGIAYSSMNTANQFLAGSMVEIGDIIAPNSDCVAELYAYTAK